MWRSRTSVPATTTYPFTFTTYTTSLPSTSFTKPTIVPSIFSFGPGLGCTSANAAPSAVPLDIPRGTQGACVISNAQEVNDHAFWDLYACCKGGDMTAFGSPNVCTAQCQAEGQSILELGDCLSKRVAKVVCKVALNERPANGSQSATSSANGSASRTASGAQGATSSPAASTGGAPAGGVVHGGSAKVVGFVFGLLAVGSAAGMML